ncbi:hypothetical protein PACTADRAFT_53676 [Pachysolen tannophilus NRRL Y-2460]|uniref:Transcription elongation factor n=1 Tax=Pachysolen tannophilus NRRL Y-2460 TaxID=669874 RepID=A0A1E4U2S3_PACTA|nr:hypothetical protein PACTADRAFT_53676 [Pachysolen tannophilus NRRL Y-2460]
MNAKEIKSVVSSLEKTDDDATILRLLTALKNDVQPTEKLLRETKVGIAVNKFRSNSNTEISSLVKQVIRSWKEAVKKKPSGAGSPEKQETDSNLISSERKYISKGPRNPKNDGVNIDIYDNATRNGSVSGLYTALAMDSDLFPVNILSIAKEIELEAFKLEYFDVNDRYRNKLRSLIMNLRNKKNPELRLNILKNEIKPHELVKMKPEEMAPESLKKEIEKIHKQNLFDAQGAVEKRAISSSFTCGKCKQKKVSYYQLQTRSADEPLTTFCTCENCGNRWKMS